MSATINELKASPGSQCSSSPRIRLQHSTNQNVMSGIGAGPTTITSGEKESVFRSLHRLCASMIKKFMSLVKGKPASRTDKLPLSEESDRLPFKGKPVSSADKLPLSEEVDRSEKVSEFVGERIDKALKTPFRNLFPGRLDRLVVHLYDGSEIVKTFFYTVPEDASGFKELVQTEVQKELLSQERLTKNSRIRVEVDFFRNETSSENHPTYGVSRAGYEIGPADKVAKDEVDFRSGMQLAYLSYYAQTKRNKELFQRLASQS